MIDFSLSQETENTRKMVHMVAESTMRPIAREYDEREHEKPTDWFAMMWNASRGMISLGDGEKKATTGEKKPSERNLRTVVITEELSWGDAGLYLSIPNAGLGGAAVSAAGTT
ncbi:MAG: acyl-CoA dehydrogenase family protein, partial [Candidatus Binatia bacterium]